MPPTLASSATSGAAGPSTPATVAEKASKQELTYFFAQWVSSTGVPFPPSVLLVLMGLDNPPACTLTKPVSIRNNSNTHAPMAAAIEADRIAWEQFTQIEAHRIMERLGLDSSSIEALVLSHGHFDHTIGLNGLAALLHPLPPLVVI